MAFLPTTVKEARQRGWDSVDVVLFTGDAYIDHPAFGAAVGTGWPAVHSSFRS